MTDAQQPHPHDQTRTEVIPALGGEGMTRTRELPVVEEAPPAAAPAAGAPPAPPVAPAPAAPAPPAPAAPALDAVAPRSRRPLVLAGVVGVLVLALVVGAVALRTAGGGSGSRATASGSASASAPLRATITSVDPSGGSGFRQDGAGWRTQTYATADFGNLKDGVGLLLDLGSPATVSRVSFDVVGGPIGVQLRAGDSDSVSGYATVATDASASGATTLTPTGGGKHRYWLVWVTKLGAVDGGYRAVLQSPVVRGTAG